MRLRLRAVWFGLISCLSISPAHAWGPAGHRIVALIAEQRLSPEVKARVAHLLLDGQFTMAQISSCPDALRAAERVPLRPDEEFCLKIAAVHVGSAPWHYIDIPVPNAGKSLDQYCPQGNCVTAKLAQFRDVLKNGNDDAQRREALMYVVHFMGDIHQPLHCAERQCDQGGNLEHVNVYLKSGERANHRLHGAWDVDLLDRLMENAKIKDDARYAAELADAISTKPAQAWSTASIDDMAWEGWKLAKDRAYDEIPDLNYCDDAVKALAPVPTDLSHGYEKEADKAIRLQLMKAGVRLANLLEQNLTH